MSQTTITLAFEQWKAQQGATGEPVLLDEFVFANVKDIPQPSAVYTAAIMLAGKNLDGIRGMIHDVDPDTGA
ncbi:phage tail protein [Salmonella enterica]|nr:phage tail protein [Salmonella enterica]